MIIKNYQTLLVKDLKDQFIGMNIKQKGRIKIQKNDYRYFLESNFLDISRSFALIYLNRSDDVTWFNARKHYLPKGIIKSYNTIINGKYFYGQVIDSDIKQYEEIWKLTIGQAEDYTGGCLLNYDYIKNHYRLIAFDLRR